MALDIGIHKIMALLFCQNEVKPPLQSLFRGAENADKKMQKGQFYRQKKRYSFLVPPLLSLASQAQGFTSLCGSRCKDA